MENSFRKEKDGLYNETNLLKIENSIKSNFQNLRYQTNFDEELKRILKALSETERKSETKTINDSKGIHKKINAFESELKEQQRKLDDQITLGRNLEQSVNELWRSVEETTEKKKKKKRVANHWQEWESYPKHNKNTRPPH